MRILVAGALGEVGSSISRALATLGHEVVAVSSRAPVAGAPHAISLAEAIRVIKHSGRRDGKPPLKAFVGWVGQGGMRMVTPEPVDLVINAAGRGDRRATDRTGTEATVELANAIAAAGLPGVLISTTRVLEGYDADYAEAAPARPLTPYAEANAANETAWLGLAGPRAHVLRITNFFAAPAGVDSPQALLLPWSLLTEGLASGSIGIRSGAGLAKEFVSAMDVASAAVLLASSANAPAVCATAPGATFTLADLAAASVAAMHATGYGEPSVTFGADGPAGSACKPGWLAEQGWSGGLDLTAMEAEMTAWITSIWARNHRASKEGSG